MRAALVGDEYTRPDRLNINNSVSIAGQLEREGVAQLMAAAHVFVLPSTVESFGLSLLEASAVGAPVVCADTGGIPETFQHEFNALLYRPGDDRAMAEAIVRLIQEKELAQRIRANAPKTASRRNGDINDGSWYDRRFSQTREHMDPGRPLKGRPFQIPKTPAGSSGNSRALDTAAR